MEYAIYLIGCTIYNLQYVRKNKISFHIRSNNEWNDLKDPKTKLADKNLQKMVIALTNTQDS